MTAVASCKLQVTSHKSQVTSHKSQVTKKATCWSPCRMRPCGPYPTYRKPSKPERMVACLLPLVSYFSAAYLHRPPLSFILYPLSFILYPFSFFLFPFSFFLYLALSFQLNSSPTPIRSYCSRSTSRLASVSGCLCSQPRGNFRI